MKSIIKRITGAVLAFSVACLSILSVGAYTTSSDFPELSYSNLDTFVDNDVLSQFYDDFYSNPNIVALGLTKDNSYFFLTYDTSANMYYVYSCLPQTFISVGGGCICPFGGTGDSLWGVYANLSPSQLDTVSSAEFSRTNYYITNSATVKPVFCFDSTLGNYYRCQVRLWYSGIFGSVCDLEPSYNPPTNPYTNFPACALYNYTEPYFPEYETYNVYMHIDTDDFYTWLVNNDKIALDSSGNISGKIPTYIGTAKLKSFIEFYKSFGSSNSSFLKNIISWFTHMNIVAQSRDNIRILKNTTDLLYKEYRDYLSSSHAYWPTATKIRERENIDTLTNDNDTTLITDDANDTIDISILRDILRGVIAISNNAIYGTDRIVTALNGLDLSVMFSNDGGVTNLSELYMYDVRDLEDDMNAFELGISEVQSVPMGYIDSINQNGLMPENMLSDKDTLTVNVPCITGYTINDNGSSYSTQTGNYILKSTDYPWLDTVVKKIKRFASILLIIGYLVHLRYRIPEIIRGE